MNTESTKFVSKSGELGFTIEGNIIKTFFGNIKEANTDEYLDTIKRIGEAMKAHKIGKVYLDTSKMSNFDITTRAAAVKTLPELVLAPAPYFVLAIRKGSSMFENMATQTALKMAKPLSKKFLDGKMFDTEQEAITWLNNFSVPAEFSIK